MNNYEENRNTNEIEEIGVENIVEQQNELDSQEDINHDELIFGSTEGMVEEAQATGETEEVHSEELVPTELTQSNQHFYREVIEKKPKTSKVLIASVLSAGLMFGTIFGYTIDNFLLDKNIKNQAASTINGTTNYVVQKTTSTVEYIAEKVAPSVVAVQTKALTTSFFGTFENEGLGSGVIISQDGYIVTNYHVVEGANNIKVVMNTGKEYMAKVVNKDEIYDLAVLKIDAKNLPYAEFGDSSALKVGELAVAIGNPVGKEYSGTVTAGIISGLNREFESGDKTLYYIQTDAAINPGNSGGALLNYEGKVIGINTLKVVQTTVEGMGFAIPSNEVKEIVDDLINRPYMGIQGKTISKEEAQAYNLPQGVYVSEVIANSGAEKAGLKKGDIIVGIDGKSIKTMEEVIEVVKKHKAEDKIEVEVVNQFNRKSKLTIQLTKNVY